MMKAGAKPAKVATIMTQKSGQVVLSRDLNNMTHGHHQMTEIDHLQKAVDEQIKLEGKSNFHYIQDEREEEIYGVYYQNDHMRKLAKTFGSVVFLDGTYKLNRTHYPCYVFVVSDNNRKSRVVAFAVVAYERQPIIDAVLEFFKNVKLLQ